MSAFSSWGPPGLSVGHGCACPQHRTRGHGVAHASHNDRASRIGVGAQALSGPSRLTEADALIKRRPRHTAKHRRVGGRLVTRGLASRPRSAVGVLTGAALLDSIIGPGCRPAKSEIDLLASPGHSNAWPGPAWTGAGRVPGDGRRARSGTGPDARPNRRSSASGSRIRRCAAPRLVVSLLASLKPEMIVPYADAAGLMLAILIGSACRDAASGWTPSGMRE